MTCVRVAAGHAGSVFVLRPVGGGQNVSREPGRAPPSQVTCAGCPSCIVACTCIHLACMVVVCIACESAALTRRHWRVAISTCHCHWGLWMICSLASESLRTGWMHTGMLIAVAAALACSEWGTCRCDQCYFQIERCAVYSGFKLIRFQPPRCKGQFHAFDTSVLGTQRAFLCPRAQVGHSRESDRSESVSRSRLRPPHHDWRSVLLTRLSGTQPEHNRHLVRACWAEQSQLYYPL